MGRGLRDSPGIVATLQTMFAAEIWHWWIGLILTIAGVLAVLQVVVGYVRKVVAPQYPKRRRRS